MINYTVYENPNTTQWVTFVHGAGGSSSIWFKQIRDFKKQYNVLLLDLRGHGDSNAPIKKAFKQHYTFKSIANDVMEVLDHLKIKTSHFVGISLGTIVIRQLGPKHRVYDRNTTLIQRCPDKPAIQAMREFCAIRPAKC